MATTLRHMLKASLLLSSTRHFASSFYALPSNSAVSSTTLRQMLSLSNNSIIALNVKASVKPEFREGLLEVLAQDALQSRTVEPGCLQFMVGIDTQNPNIIHLHEQYENQDALDFHNETPHLKAVGEFIEKNDALTEPITVQSYACQHTPTKIDNSQFQSFCLNVESCIKPELREQFMELMTSHQENSKKEPLCLQFDWGVSTEDPNTFYIHEEYAGKEDGKEGFDAHESSAHFAKFVQFNVEKQPYSKPQVVQFFKNLKV